MRPDSVIPILGRIDNFWIIVALVIASAIWDWLKKKGLLEDTDSAPGKSEPPRQPATPPPSRADRPLATSDWEAELRRLLGGEVPAAKPSTAPPPTPPRSVPGPQPSPPLIVRTAPQVARPEPVPLAGRRIAAADKAVEVNLPQLQESATAYHRANQLHEEMAEQMKRVDQMTQRHTSKVPIVRRHSQSAEAAQTILLMRHPGTARQAVISSIVFGPPKALGGE